MPVALVSTSAVVLLWLLAASLALLWGRDTRRLRRRAIACTLHALAAGLDELGGRLEGDAAHPTAERCRHLCAALRRVVRA